MSSLIGYKIHTVHKKHVSLSENIGFNLVCVLEKTKLDKIERERAKKPGKLHLEDARHKKTHTRTTENYVRTKKRN